MRCTIIGLLCVALAACSANLQPLEKPIDKSTEGEFHEKEAVISEVTLGPGDAIEISVWRNPDLDGKYEVDPTGKIFFPLVGALDVNYMGVHEVRENVVKGLSKYIVDPQVRMIVTSYQSRKIYVLGEILKPGIFQMSVGMSLIEGVVKAGGFTKDANQKKVLVIRGGLDNGTVRAFNIADFLEKGELSQNVLLKRGDIVYIPSSFISNVDRFFQHLDIILTPILKAERGIVFYPRVEDILRGDEAGSTISIITP